jgi:hypothetical protein
VILQPGLPHEVDTVKRIFHLFTQDSKTKQEIADQLNKENIPNQLGRPWVRSSIQRMLSNEKYIGNNVYNLTSSKLGQKNARNPSSVWMRVEGAFERIIDTATFEAAQRIMAQRRLEKPPRDGILKNSEILRSLAQLFAEKGCLTTEMINAAGGLPHSTLYRKRFGSLKRAYELVGYQQEKNFQYYDGRRAVTATIASVAAELSTQIRTAGRTVDFDERTSTLTINDAATVSIFVARSVRLPTGSLRWKIGRKIGRCSNLVVVARMKETNESILDYYLLPHSEIPERRIEFQDWPRFDAFRIEVGEGLAQAILSSLGPSV